MKAEKKAAEKEAKVKEQVDQKTNDKSEQKNYGADEETLDPNVRTKNYIYIKNDRVLC